MGEMVEMEGKGDEGKVMEENSGGEAMEVEEDVEENGEVENGEVKESGMAKPNLTQLVKPLYEDPTLPEGWKRGVTQRTEGASAGKWDVYINGMGKRFRSRPDLERYLEENKITDIKAEDIDFTVWGKGVKAPQTPRTPRTPKTKTPKIPKEKSSAKKTKAVKKIVPDKKKPVKTKEATKKKSLSEAKKPIEGPVGSSVKMKFNFKKRKQ